MRAIIETARQQPAPHSRRVPPFFTRATNNAEPRMTPKSGFRFSDKVMRNEKAA
jgi:hypothetical protein